MYLAKPACAVGASLLPEKLVSDKSASGPKWRVAQKYTMHFTLGRAEAGWCHWDVFQLKGGAWESH